MLFTGLGECYAVTGGKFKDLIFWRARLVQSFSRVDTKGCKGSAGASPYRGAAKLLDVREASHFNRER